MIAAEHEIMMIRTVHRMLKRKEGFTLLEVLIAFVLLASTVTVILQLFSSDLRVIARSEDHVWMSARAMAVMREVLDGDDLKEGTRRDTDPGGFVVETVIRRTLEKRTRELPLDLMEITVKLTWQGAVGERSTTLRTMKMVKKEQAGRM
jgi:general secretion pathway protein I